MPFQGNLALNSVAPFFIRMEKGAPPASAHICRFLRCGCRPRPLNYMEMCGAFYLMKMVCPSMMLSSPWQQICVVIGGAHGARDGRPSSDATRDCYLPRGSETLAKKCATRSCICPSAIEHRGQSRRRMQQSSSPLGDGDGTHMSVPTRQLRSNGMELSGKREQSSLPCRQ